MIAIVEQSFERFFMNRHGKGQVVVESLSRVRSSLLAPIIRLDNIKLALNHVT